MEWWFKVNFLRPAYGESLVCRSRIIREGLQIIIGESEVFDQRENEEALVAKALVTLMAVHKEKLLPKAWDDYARRDTSSRLLRNAQRKWTKKSRVMTARHYFHEAAQRRGGRVTIFFSIQGNRWL